MSISNNFKIDRDDHPEQHVREAKVGDELKNDPDSFFPSSWLVEIYLLDYQFDFFSRKFMDQKIISVISFWILLSSSVHQEIIQLNKD